MNRHEKQKFKRDKYEELIAIIEQNRAKELKKIEDDYNKHIEYNEDYREKNINDILQEEKLLLKTLEEEYSEQLNNFFFEGITEKEISIITQQLEENFKNNIIQVNNEMKIEIDEINNFIITRNQNLDKKRKLIEEEINDKYDNEIRQINLI